jgi:hypothetical protein
MHCDIIPENIIKLRNFCSICDFGIFKDKDINKIFENAYFFGFIDTSLYKEDDIYVKAIDISALYNSRLIFM